MSYIPSLISLGLQTIFLWLFEKWKKKCKKNAGSLGTIETNRIGSERVNCPVSSCRRTANLEVARKSVRLGKTNSYPSTINDRGLGNHSMQK